MPCGRRKNEGYSATCGAAWKTRPESLLRVGHMRLRPTQVLYITAYSTQKAEGMDVQCDGGRRRLAATALHAQHGHSMATACPWRCKLQVTSILGS